MANKRDMARRIRTAQLPRFTKQRQDVLLRRFSEKKISRSRNVARRMLARVKVQGDTRRRVKTTSRRRRRRI